MPLILASYFGTLIFAIRMFPGPFDWRTKSMSKLLYPENNPRFHTVASVGLAVAGLATIPFAGWIARRLRVMSPALADIGAIAFAAGCLSLILGATIVLQPFLHEFFARGAGICFGLGMLAFYLCAMTGVSVSSDEERVRPPVFFGWSVIVPPALVIIVLRLLAAVHFQWSNPLYRTIENRSFWHLGFWEWIGSIAIYLFIIVAVLLLPEHE
jgi:hypothetical protein